MATFERRTTKSGRRRIRAVVRRKGHPAIRRTFATLKAARDWSRTVETEIAAGRYVVAGDRTVRDLVDRYIATIAPQKKTGDRTIQQLRTWSELIGPIELDALRPADLAEARDTIAETRGPATVVRYLSALSHAFTIAVKDWQWIADNPLRRITWPRQPRGRVRFLSDDERERLLAACQRNPVLQAIVTLALLTGMRRGEILSIRWRDVDLERRRVILHDTKNRERRQVPLVETAFALFVGMVSGNNVYHVRPGASDYVFHRRLDPTRPVDITHTWRMAVRHAGLEDFRFHDLRHTAASYLAMEGATTNEIAEILGHKTLDMVKRYAHLTTSHSATVLERLETKINKPTGDRST